MGSLRNLSDENLNTHLLLTKSNMSEMYIYDILKGKCKASRDSVFDVNSKKSFDNMIELVNIQPFLADRWLFVIDYSKVKKQIADKKGIFLSESSEFLINVKNYKDYKEVKDLLGKVNDVYLSYINFYDTEYLLKDSGISDKLISFVYKSYSSDPEQVFVLLKELKSGTKVETRKHISDICGVSTGSLNSFAISLLGDEPKGIKGHKMVIRNRIKVALELSEVYGFRKMRNFLVACVKDILDIKTLYLTGIIYDRISDIPEVYVKDEEGNKVLVYDEKRLSRYKNYLDTIKNIPYQRIVGLYLMLKEWGIWYKDTDMINFIYQYYEKGEI